MEFNDVFRNLSVELCDELNHDFLELFESTTEVDPDDDVVQEYIMQDELMLRLEEEERWRIEEENILEDENRLRLEEEEQMRVEQQNKLIDEANNKKRSKAFMNSGHMRIYRQSLVPVKRTQYTSDLSAYYWS